MSIFCRHDWVSFKESIALPHKTIKKVGFFFGDVYYVSEQYYSKEDVINPSINKKIATKWNHSLGAYAEPITDDVCSKCFKTRLNLQKAKEKSIRRENARDKANAKLRKRETKIADRRNSAKEWATKFISMKEKA